VNASDGDPRREPVLGGAATATAAAVAPTDGGATVEPVPTESTSPPISASGVRLAEGKKAFRLRDSAPFAVPGREPHFRPLTPYQARLDVEMDDTAISKVRDPSVSIALGADAALSPREGSRLRSRRSSRAIDAAISVSVGLVLGALMVVLTVLVLRALGV
jgi:hypothetical protein